jgi:hypothetical protein
MREQRATAQLLHRPTRRPVAIVRHLLGVQAQDQRAFPLALRARGSGFAASDVQAALAAGDLVVAWLMRGTLHCVTREDHGWLLALTAPRNLTGNARRLRQMGIGERRTERAVARIAEALPATRPELKALLRTEGQQTVHLIMRAALEGVCVLGAERKVVAAPKPQGGGDLGARYLAAHAPAAPEDLAAWAGISLGAARRAWSDVDPPDPEPLPPRLLPMWDDYLLGWKDRSFLGPKVRAAAPGNGMIRAVAVRDGRIEATWSKTATPPRAYAGELADVERFLGT